MERTIEYDAFLYTDDNREAVDVLSDGLPAVPKVIAPGTSGRGWEVYELPDGVEPARLMLFAKIGDDPVTVEL